MTPSDQISMPTFQKKYLQKCFLNSAWQPLILAYKIEPKIQEKFGICCKPFSEI